MSVFSPRVRVVRCASWCVGALLLASVLLRPVSAEAFCGFYAGSAGADLFNDATQVVLMRDGTRTVLSMQNHYRGPAEDFAMVVPVPQVLRKRQVKTLPHDLFERLDRFTAPRLVEYFETDPCRPRRVLISADRVVITKPGSTGKVKVKARFSVGEYDVVILKARGSVALERWLRRRKYNIPKGAARALKGYVQQGMYFFVAKVNIKRVKRDAAGRMVLSPLRFHYSSKRFALPVRLGLLNAKSSQDLIVHILARGQRYEAANYPNVIMPTNLLLPAAAMPRFGALYRGLFDRVQALTPGAVATEYAWDVATCDPCPSAPPDQQMLLSLGADVMPARKGRAARAKEWVVTRLHTRLSASSTGADLVFRRAAPIAGGQGTPQGLRPVMEHAARPSSRSQFQVRAIALHPWKGAKIEAFCKTGMEPLRGRWRGRPLQTSGSVQGMAFLKPSPASSKLLLRAVSDAALRPKRSKKGAKPGAAPKP